MMMKLSLILSCAWLCVTLTFSTSCPKVTTFNTGLLTRIENYDQRQQLIKHALKNHDTDVYCLQEVWLESDMESILETVQSVYPYHYSGIHHGQGNLRRPYSEMSWLEKARYNMRLPSAACSVIDSTKFVLLVGYCVVKNGCQKLDSGSPAFAHCITQNCKSALKKVSPGCIQCITLMASGIIDMGSKCVSNLLNRDNRLNPSGLVILSKRPLGMSEYKPLWPGHSQIIERGYIQAEVPDIGHVVCTHLTSIFPTYMEYDMDFTNFEEQNAAEVLKILNTEYPSSIVMGDLNVGPAAVSAEAEKTLTGEYPEIYAEFLESGYSNPYVEENGLCTYCDGNPIIGPNPHGNEILDHILIRAQMFNVKDAKRVFDDDRPVLSDHYGVQVELCLKPSYRSLIYDDPGYTMY